jgi:hypothetical protein
MAAIRVAGMSPAWFTPQSHESDLAPHAHRLELGGAPSDFVWPDLCPACGGAARDRLDVRKVFVRRSRGHGGRTRHVIACVTVPFCEKCVDRHHAEAHAMSPLRRGLTYVQSFLLIPAVGAGYMASVTLPAARGASLDQPAGLWAWGLVAFFAGISVMSLVAMWQGTKRFRVPPQTSVTRAFDYSDELGSMVEGRRRVYTIQDGGFAERFASINGELARTTEHERRGLWRVGILIGLAIAGLLTWRVLAG